MTDAARTPLDDLLDKQAITEVLYRYCRGCDRAEEQAIRACFHPDSMHRHGGFEGTSVDFTAMAMKIIRNSGAELDYFTGGRYLDRFEKRAGAWKIAQRVGLIDFERHETPDPGSRLPQSQLSQRFPEDELYRSFMFDRPTT
jgi:hypothetical protein